MLDAHRASVVTARHKPATLHRTRQRVRKILWLVAAILMANALVGDGGLLMLRKARQDGATLGAAIVDLRRDNNKLREKAQRLKHDPDEIESLARHELGLAKPGEVLFIVRDVNQVSRRSVPGSLLVTPSRPAQHVDSVRDSP